MSANRNLDKCFVLHRKPWREKSLLLDVFSREQGRCKIIARGQRTAKKSSSNFEPFQEISLIIRGNTELKTLINAESTQAPLKISGERLFCGFYINELINKIVPIEDASHELFDAYFHALLSLEDCDNNIEAVLRQFERALFVYSGLGFDDQFCSSGRPIEKGITYDWVIGKGWIRQDVNHTAPFSGDFILNINQPISDHADLLILKKLHRHLINELLAGRELTSRKLFKKL